MTSHEEMTLFIDKRASSAGFSAAAEAAEMLQRAGYRAVLVGGCVRDLLLGRVPHDYDLLTTAKPEETLRLFPEAKLVGASFGVLIVRRNGIDFEIASARSERFYMDGRHPGEVKYTDDLSVDAQRRDFTVNALMADPVSGAIFDYVGGIDDLKRGILRTVGDAECRFSEDYLRILRAVRFAAELGFEADPAMVAAIRRSAALTAEIAGERVRAEVEKMLLGRDPARAFELMRQTGVLKYVLPEVDALAGVTQPPQFHPEGDVFDHTMLMLRHLRLADAPTAWSVLFHDVGKPECRTVDPDGRIRFFNHEERGAEMVTAVAQRLRFSNEITETVKTAVRNHMRFAAVTTMREAKVKRLIAAPSFPVELELHRLDCLCSNGLMEGFEFLLKRLAEQGGVEALPPPWLTGRDLIAAGMMPGPALGKMLKELYDRQLSGEFENREAALQFALKGVENGVFDEKIKKNQKNQDKTFAKSGIG